MKTNYFTISFLVISVFISSSLFSQINITETHIDKICYYGSTGSIDLTVTGGLPPYTFDWDNDASGDNNDTEDLFNLNDGQYCVIVIDQNQDTASLCVIISAPDNLQLVPSYFLPLCPLDSNGSIEMLIEGGTPPYTFCWESALGDTISYDQNLENIPQGSYRLNLKDSNLCPSSRSCYLKDPDNLALIIDTINNTLCSGQDSSKIEILIVGGTPDISQSLFPNGDPYAYNWSQGQTTEDIYGLSPGIYTITVTDANGCILEDSVTTTFNPSIANINGTHLSTDTILYGDTLWLYGQPAPLAYQTYSNTHLPRLISPITYNTSPLLDITINSDRIITDASDMKSICLTLEHSYMSDLSIELLTPSGNSLDLMGYPNSGNGRFLGEAVDSDSYQDSVGIGYTYCWTNDANILLEEAGYNNDQYLTPVGIFGPKSVISGNYLPEESFSSLVGCPVGSDPYGWFFPDKVHDSYYYWGIKIKDNLAMDNGYTFGWSITILDHLPTLWVGDSIFEADNDTSFSIPTNVGWQDYTYSIENECGQIYDTTISVYVLPIDTLFFINPNEYDAPNQQINLTLESCGLDFYQIDSALVSNYTYLNDTLSEISIHIYIDGQATELVEIINTPTADIYEIEIILNCPSGSANNIVVKITDYIDTETYTNFEYHGKSVIKLFPNPNNGQFRLSFDKTYSGIINIYNIGGHKKSSHQINNQNNWSNIENFESGVYFIQIIFETKQSKILKMMVK